MANGFLAFKGSKSAIGGIEIDLTHSVEHSYAVEATDRPVLVGANITDHARCKPIELSIKGKFTSTSNMPDEAAPLGARGAAEETADILVGLRNAPGVVQVITPFTSYDDMLIVDLSITTDAQTGDAVEFTAKLKQVTFVTTAMTVVATKISRAKKTAVKGEAPTAPMATLGPAGQAKFNAVYRANLYNSTGQYNASPLP
jgi:hypothetical protein